MSGDPLVLSHTFSKTNDRSYILTNIDVTEKQEFFLAAKTFQRLASNVMNFTSTDFNLFLVMAKLTIVSWSLSGKTKNSNKCRRYYKLKAEFSLIGWFS